MNSLDFLEKIKYQKSRREIKPFRCYYMYQFCVLCVSVCACVHMPVMVFLWTARDSLWEIHGSSGLPGRAFTNRVISLTCEIFFCFDLVLRRGLTMSTWLVCNSFHRPSWPWTHRDLLCFCPSRAEIQRCVLPASLPKSFFFLKYIY